MGGKKEFELHLEIGQRSRAYPKPLANGYTHKWTVYVRGKDNAKIEHCIQKVVFHLHESFENPTREIFEPPYQVTESGYAGFVIPIQIHFRGKEKNNLLEFEHDLCLLNGRPNDKSRIENIKIINPGRDFERCLLKSGAHLMTNPSRKDRSDSPPAKKHKSSTQSSLIPSKDMSKISQPATLTHHNNNGHHSHNSNFNHNNNNTSSSLINNHNSNNHIGRSSNSGHSSKDFIDIFGKPLSLKGPQSNGSASVSSSASGSTSISSSSAHNGANASSHPNIGGNINNQANANTSASTSNTNRTKSPALNGVGNTTTSSKINGASVKDSKTPCDLKQIQKRISCLNDPERLQKVVDIIEYSGEWFNLTPNRFQFDLTRLDSKTLHKIERCLNI